MQSEDPDLLQIYEFKGQDFDLVANWHIPVNIMKCYPKWSVFDRFKEFSGYGNKINVI